MPEDLDRRADREYRLPRGRGTLQSGIPGQVAGGQALRVILCATEGVDVERIGDLVVEGDLDDLRIDAAHAGALPQHERIAAVAVGAHDVGQDESDAQCRLTHACPFRARSARSIATLRSRKAV